MRNEIFEEVTRSSQMMALGECCKSAKKGLKGKTLCKDGIARRLSLKKKKRKADKKVTNGRTMGTGTTFEETVERRRVEGSSLKLDVMPKVPELVVNERMSQGKRVKHPKE